MVICLTRANLKIRNYPDISVQINGFLRGGYLYRPAGEWVIPVMALIVGA
jgi:hypothetical protein